MYKNGKMVLLGKIILVAIVAFIWLSFDSITGNVVKTPSDTDPYPSKDVKALTIATWNLQIFGVTKAANEELLQDYVSILDDFDIVFVQEIRDKSESAFQTLCARLPDYTCAVSARAGRSASKEQYGVLYRDVSLETGKSIKLIKLQDSTPDQQDRWERPPLAATFAVDGYVFTAYTIHIKPAAVQQELAALEALVPDKGNILILGDFNADCSYYNAQQEQEFDTWHWIIRDTADTTVAQSSCTYDRILLNDDALEEYGKKGIVTAGITEVHSDHYLIWVGLEPKEK